MHLNTVTIGVVMINFNNDMYLKESIESVLNQTRIPDELLILDDCSSDNSINIIREFMAKHDFIKLLQNPHNLGPAANRHKAILNSSSNFVVTLDSDDFLQTEHINNVLNALIYKPNSVVISDFKVCDNSGYEIEEINTQGFSILSSNNKIRFLASRNRACPGNQMSFSKKTYIKIGGIDIRLRMYEDLDLIFNAVLSNIEFQHTGKVGYTYRKSKNGISITTSKGKHLFQLFWVLWKNCKKSKFNIYLIFGIILLLIQKAPLYLLGTSKKHGFN